MATSSTAARLQPVLVESVPGNSAVYYEDCQHITASRGHTCDLCGSSAIWSLSATLGLAEIKSETAA